MNLQDLSREDLLSWLACEDIDKLKQLWKKSDTVRRKQVGDGIHLRGLVEFTNICRRGCAYCGLRAANSNLVRYRMSSEEVLECAERAVEFGYGTLVLQGGEDPSMTALWLAGVIEAVKANTNLAVTLSVGQWPLSDYKLWYKCGANRVLIRFETSNGDLFRKIHPGHGTDGSDRKQLLMDLREIGYEIGSGVMVGLPGQSLDDLVDDLEEFVRLDLDMIGLGPFIPNCDTPLGRECSEAQGKNISMDREQMTYKMLALSRLLLPRTNIPSTSALATLTGGAGRLYGLDCGANVIMPNLTPEKYRQSYALYPGKSHAQNADEYDKQLKEALAAMKRTVAAGPGNSLAYNGRGTVKPSHLG